MHQLGAGFDDILPIGFGLNSGRLKNILASLKSEESSIQLDGLSQLCELLSISTEVYFCFVCHSLVPQAMQLSLATMVVGKRLFSNDQMLVVSLPIDLLLAPSWVQEALTSFPVDEFVPILVQLLGEEHSPDMMLFAARALTFLADVLPSSCNAIVGYNAVPAFCARLLNIEYIDLAEQSLQALGKIAAEHPGACLQAGGMCAVLSFLDFFPTSMQHVAVVTAANMANGASPSCIDQVKDTVPILTNLLQHHDPKVVDNSCLALSRLADAISKHPQYLEDICTKNLIEQVMNLISLTSNGSMTTNLNISTYFGLIRLLATCASALPVVAEMLLQVANP